MATSYFRDPDESYKAAQRRRKLERYQQQQPKQAPTQPAAQAIAAPTPIQSPNAVPRVAAGGLRVTPGGRPLAPASRQAQQSEGAGIEGDIRQALGGLQRVAKPAGQVADRFMAPVDSGTFDRGTSEPAFQSQRQGERADFRTPLPGEIGGPMPTQAYTGPQIFAPAGAPPMPTSQSYTGPEIWAPAGAEPMPGAANFQDFASSSGSLAEVAPGSASTGGMNAGMSGSQIGGLASSGLGALMSAYGLYQGVESGSPSAIAGSAYGLANAGLSTAASAGSTAAQTAMAAAGPWLSVAAPVIVGVLGYLQAQEQKAAMRKAGLKLRGQLGVEQNKVGQEGAELGQLDPNDIDPAKRQQYVDLLNRMFQTQDPTSGAGQIPTGGIAVGMSPMENAYHMANAGPNPSATGDNQAQMNEYGKALLASVPAQYQRLVYELMQNPNLKLPSWEVGGQKTADVLKSQLEGMQVAGQPGEAPTFSTWYEHLPNTPQPYVTETQFGPQGPEQYTVPNPELGGQFPNELLSSPYFAQAYWQSKGVTPQQAYLYGTGQQAAQYGGLAGVNLPGTEGGFGGYDPAALYQSLVAQGMPDLAAQQVVAQQVAPDTAGAVAPTAGATAPADTAQAGSTEVASAVGGAGKLAPTFATPELDRVTEITSAGKRGGQPAPQAQPPGRPFGMGQPQGRVFGQRGGMNVGGPFAMGAPQGAGSQTGRSIQQVTPTNPRAASARATV